MSFSLGEAFIGLARLVRRHGPAGTGVGPELPGKLAFCLKDYKEVPCSEMGRLIPFSSNSSHLYAANVS